MKGVLRVIPIFLCLVLFAPRDVRAADATKTIVFPKPVFQLQPTNRTVSVGQQVEFTASAAGALMLGFQWHKDGTPIPGATTTRYIIQSARGTDRGKYALEARNVGGSVFSTNATLNVTCTYTLSSNGTFFSFEGGSGRFSVSASGSCGWKASTTNSWVTITSSNSNPVTFTVQTNDSTVARTGLVKVGNKSFVVAQGPKFAPATLFNKTLAMKIQSGSGNLPINGSFVFRGWGTGTNQGLSRGIVTTNLLGTNGYSSFAYSPFTNTGSKSGQFNFQTNTFALLFDSISTGTFTVTNAAGDTQSGTFRLANATPDLNLDGFADFGVQSTNIGTNLMDVMYMVHTNFAAESPWLTMVSVQPKPIGMADFNGDSVIDSWLTTSEGSIAVFPTVFRTNGTFGLSFALPIRGGQKSAPWKPVAVNDFNSDERPDILFQHPDRRVALWFLNGTNFLGSRILHAAAAGWEAVGTGDMNGDRQTDIVFQHDSGKVAVWLMHAGYFIASQPVANAPSVSTGSRVVSIGDFNSDGHMDIIWQTVTDQVVAWFMNGLRVTHQVPLFSNETLAEGWDIFGPK